MKKRKAERKKKIGAISTFIGNDAVIEGAVGFQGTLHLEGALKGEIASEDGALIIGESAVVEARIVVDSAIIKGTLRGIIEARSSIDATGSANVTGEMYAPIISIDPGAVFNGNCGTSKKPSSAGKAPDSPEIQEGEEAAE